MPSSKLPSSHRTVLRTDAGDRAAVRPTRRRMIDPTTCDRDYSQDELEFMQAIESYKRRSGRMFPTCSELLEVVRSLGYERVVVPA